MSYYNDAGELMMTHAQARTESELDRQLGDYGEARSDGPDRGDTCSCCGRKFWELDAWDVGTPQGLPESWLCFCNDDCFKVYMALSSRSFRSSGPFPVLMKRGDA